MTSPPPRRRRRRRDEEGVSLVLVALIMVAMLVMAALVVDLGSVRATKRTNQALADFAALSAGRAMAGQGQVPAVSNPRAACRAALASLSQNATGFPASPSFPCDSFATSTASCTSSTAATTAGPQSLGGYTVEMVWPVPDTMITTPERPADPDPDGKRDATPCQRFAVRVARQAPTFWNGVTRSSGYTPSAMAVAKGALSLSGSGVAALLLLERDYCGVLQASGQGSIVVQAVAGTATTPQEPGRIHVDSRGATSGSGTPCTTNTNASGFPVFANSTNTRIIACPQAGEAKCNIQSGTQGSLTIHAASLNPPGRTWCCTGFVAPAGSPGSVSSRVFADHKYDNADRRSNPATVDTVTELRDLALQRVGNGSGTAATSPASGPSVVVTDCSTLTAARAATLQAALDPLTSPRTLRFDCGGGRLEVSGAVNLVVERVHVRGALSVANGQSLNLPTAQQVFLQGCQPGCPGGSAGNSALSVAGSLFVNSGLTSASCATAANAGAGSGGTNTRTVQLVVNGGDANVTGTLRLCQTTMLLGQAAPRQSTTSGGLNCSAVLPCPTDTGTGNGFISITGGSPTVEWTAPNQSPTGTEDGLPPVSSPFEDLALWQESSSASTEIKGQGANSVSGVFFAPNATARFSGQAAQDQPLNAQFIARRFNASGQGDLNLRPNPADAIRSPAPGGVSLIR